MGGGGGTGHLPGPDVFIPGLKSVYMVGGTGCFYPRFKICLYGRRDRMFFILGLKSVLIESGTGCFFIPG